MINRVLVAHGLFLFVAVFGIVHSFYKHSQGMPFFAFLDVIFNEKTVILILALLYIFLNTLFIFFLSFEDRE